MRTISLIAAVALAAGSSGSTFAATAVHPTVAPVVTHAPTTVVAPKATVTPKATPVPAATPKATPTPAPLHVSASFGGATSMWASVSIQSTGRQVTLIRPAGGGATPHDSTVFKTARIVGPHQTLTLSNAIIESTNTRGGFTSLVVRYATIQIQNQN